MIPVAPYENGQINNPPMAYDSVDQISQESFGDSNLVVPALNWDSSWLGADGSYSIQLPNGEVAWFYSDTYYGNYNKDGTASNVPTTPIRNSFVLQESATSQVKHSVFVGGQVGQAYFQANSQCSEGTFFWVIAAHLKSSSDLQVFLSTESIVNYVPDQVGTCIADIDLSSLGSTPTYTDITSKAMINSSNLCSGNSQKALFGESALTTYVSTTQYTYIYGVATCGFDTYEYAARVSGTDLTSSWSYFTGSSTCSSQTNSFSSSSPTPLCDNESGTAYVYGGGEESVVLDGGAYRLVSSWDNIFNIYLATSSSPVGPFTVLAKVSGEQSSSFPTFEGQSVSPYNTTPVSGCALGGYNAKEHPELESSGNIVISYNVNAFGCSGSPFTDNVENYRPRFVVMSGSQLYS